MTVRAVVADDHPIVRDGLRVLLATLPDITMVGEATTGREAVRAPGAPKPSGPAKPVSDADVRTIAGAQIACGSRTWHR